MLGSGFKWWEGEGSGSTPSPKHFVDLGVTTHNQNLSAQQHTLIPTQTTKSSVEPSIPDIASC